MVSNILYYNQAQQYPQIRRDYKDVKKHVDKVDDTDKGLFYALESLPPVRRLSSLPDKIQNGDYAPAIGLASLALINLPEDCRDIKASGKQLHSILTGKEPNLSYDYKNYQHKFSFYRGTLLKDFVNPNKANNPELAKKLLKSDKTLLTTKFGEKLLKLLNVEAIDIVNTSTEDILHTKEKPIYVEAFKFEGKGNFKAFGELTARAMTRTTLIGTGILAVLELPKIFKAMGQGDNISEQTGNTAKQTIKSGVNVASITAGIAYGGAIGAKKFGPTGSIVGMGLGAIFGSFTSTKIQSILT